MEYFQNLIKEYGDHSYRMAAILSLVFWVFFIARYIKGQEQRSNFTKIFDIISMFFLFALFVLYVVVGIQIGETYFASTVTGFCIGVIAFWLMFEVLALFKKKRTKA